jgi:hypothetical protein
MDQGPANQEIEGLGEIDIAIPSGSEEGMSIKDVLGESCVMDGFGMPRMVKSTVARVYAEQYPLFRIQQTYKYLPSSPSLWGF